VTDISVIICSNRLQRLAAVLESACALDVPPGLEWELVVVANGGQTPSAEASAPFAGRLPVRAVDEPVPGLCPARNRGSAEARGRYLCWTDDDVLLDRGWLAAYAAAFARHPEAAVFGGRILPEPEPPAEPWFVRSLKEWPVANIVARRDFGDFEAPVALEGGRIPWGANYAIRAEEQRRYAYNMELGFSPFHRRTGEETDLIYRILRDGGSGWWVPDAKVRHLIPPERQTLDYLDRYFEQAGQTVAFLHDRFPGDNANEVLGTPLLPGLGGPALALATAGFDLIARAALLAGPNRLALRFLARASYCRGILAHRRGARIAAQARAAESVGMEKAA
jgi:glycosyltransferase involved in cell wall biosynthesis